MQSNSYDEANINDDWSTDPTYAVIMEELSAECVDCAEWHEHEHTTPAVQIQAEHLLDAAGSAELAKHAIDVAAQRVGE